MDAVHRPVCAVSNAAPDTSSRQWQPRQWARALVMLPPECRGLALRRVPRHWRPLVAYMAWVYAPALQRLQRAMDAAAASGP